MQNKDNLLIAAASTCEKGANPRNIQYDNYDVSDIIDIFGKPQYESRYPEKRSKKLSHGYINYYIYGEYNTAPFRIFIQDERSYPKIVISWSNYNTELVNCLRRYLEANSDEPPRWEELQ